MSLLRPRIRLGLPLLLGLAIALSLARHSALAADDKYQELQDLPPIYFYSGSSEIDDESRERCEKVATYLKQNPKVRLVLKGGTDPSGSAALNRRLGRQRGESAKKVIRNFGVAAGRITVAAPNLADAGGTGDSRFLRYVKFLFVGEPGGGAVAAVVPPVPPVPSTAVASRPSSPTVTPSTSSKTPSSVATAPKTSAKVASVGTILPTSGSAPSAPAVEPPSRPGLERINVVFWRAPNHMLWAIAKAKGYFREEGFDVNLVESQDSAKKIARMIDGSVDVLGNLNNQVLKAQIGKGFFAGAVCAYGFEDAVASKRPLVQIGTMINMTDAYLMKKEFAKEVVKDLKALRGKTVGVPLTYDRGKPDRLLPVLLAKNGLKENVDYKVKLYQGGSTHEVFQDLIAGKVDMAWSIAPLDVSFLRKNPDYTKINMASFYPYMPCCRQVVPRDQLAKNRGKYVRFQRAVIKAERLFIERPKEALVIIASFLKMPVSVAREMFSGQLSLISDPNLKGSTALDAVYRGKRQDLGEFVDTSLYEEALLSLAKDSPDVAFYKSAVKRYKRQN